MLQCAVQADSAGSAEGEKQKCAEQLRIQRSEKENKMKKRITVLALAFTMVFTMLALAACGGSDSSSDSSSASDAEYGEGYVFKHGFDLDYPPYSYRDDNGEVGGFDVEMAKAVCEYYGWEYEAVPFNWDAKDAELQAGSCDAIWSGFTMNGREDDYLWSQPYSDNTQMIMVPEDSDIKSLDDLSGKKVGVQTATSAYDMLNDEEGQKKLADTFGSLEVYETYTIAFNDLQAGAIDAIAIDVTSGNFLMNNTEGYKYLDDVLSSEQYAIGFRKDDTVLCDKINEALNELAADGTVAKIAENYPDIADYITLGKE